MKKKILILFMVAFLALGSFIPVLNAEGNETEDKIYYWKVYSVDIAPGEENLIEWINPTIWKGEWYCWDTHWRIGYDTIEFHNIDGDNYVMGSDQKTLAERKVGDTFYDIGSWHVDVHERKLNTTWTPLRKNTIREINPFTNGDVDKYNVGVDSFYAYKHIGYARSYNSNTFEKWELERYGETSIKDYRFYYKHIDTPPTGEVNWIEDDGFQEDYKKKHPTDPGKENPEDPGKEDPEEPGKENPEDKAKIEELEKSIAEKDTKIADLEKQIEDLKKLADGKESSEFAKRQQELLKALEDKIKMERELEALRRAKEQADRDRWDRERRDREYWREYYYGNNEPYNRDLEYTNNSLKKEKKDLEKQVAKLKEEKENLKYHSTSREDYVTIFSLDSTLYKTYLGQEFLSQAEMTDFAGYITPFVKDNRTMLPIRYVALALGLEVKWDGDTKTATFSNYSGNNVLAPGTVTISANTLKMTDHNGQSISTSTDPILTNGRFYISITDIARAFGGSHGLLSDFGRSTIEWDQNGQRVLVYKYVK